MQLVRRLGWNGNQAKTPVTVNRYADGNSSPFYSITADQFRQDLLDAKIGDGKHALSLTSHPV